MLDAKDPAIKLFGKTIPLPDCQIPMDSGEKPIPVPMPESDDEKDAHGETTHEEDEDQMTGSYAEGAHEPNSSSGVNGGMENDHQVPSRDKTGMDDSKAEEEHTDAGDGGGQEKVLKKPSKILPCPRCNSLDTKFCYYNNYNVNQPRHFCKNCQRYWTAGGTMRNVPVGAGRRKNKHSSSHYRHIVMSSDGVPAARVDASAASHHQVLSCGLTDHTQSLKGNGTVLKFGPDAPLCESMAAVLNLGDQKRNVGMAPVCGENKEEPSCGSSATGSTCLDNEFAQSSAQNEQVSIPVGCFNGLPPAPPLQLYPGPPWAYPWNPGWNNMAAVAPGRCSSELVCVPENSNNSKPAQWNSPPMVAAPAFCAPSIPFPFVPASYWSCVPGWAAGPWNVPWVGPNGSLSPLSSTSDTGCSGNGSPTLGKHSRDMNTEGEEKQEKCLWFPKTLRIDDPDEAAKSSIWATLGIKQDESKPITKGGIFKAFQPSSEGKSHPTDAEQVLHANPAALSRSQTFQEST